MKNDNYKRIVTQTKLKSMIIMSRITEALTKEEAVQLRQLINKIIKYDKKQMGFHNEND